ncbi:hypothetical protein BN1723_011648 [Verticillium longisporum]|uniref:Uncharacterized protein n=1 Tax=Verticillium longisporum TaxID=100787 RepID=A0A0G4LA95_VERLO|nr:hypothetical protein BN1723_011648 [Verticillium longisporum]
MATSWTRISGRITTRKRADKTYSGRPAPTKHGRLPSPPPPTAPQQTSRRYSLETAKEQAPLPFPKPVHDTMKSRVQKLRAVDVGSSVGRQHVRGVFRVIPEVGRRNGRRVQDSAKHGAGSRQGPRERGRKRKSKNEQTAGGRRGQNSGQAVDIGEARRCGSRGARDAPGRTGRPHSDDSLEVPETRGPPT